MLERAPEPVEAVEKRLLRRAVEFDAGARRHIVKVTKYFTLYPQSVTVPTGCNEAVPLKERG